MTLPAVSIAGTPYDIGVALGRQAGGGLSALLESVSRYRDLKKSWLGSKRLAALEAAARSAYPQHVRTIEGIADGAAMPFQEIFLWNCRGDLPNKETDSGTLGCTSVLLPGNENGNNVIGHNEDGEREFEGHCFLATVKPDRSVGFTSFCYPGLLPGHAFAINDAGLVQTINHIRANDMVVGIPRHLVTHAVISSRTLDEALEILRRRDRASAFNHNLAQMGDPRVLSVEAPAGACDIEEISGPYAHANHLLRFPGHDQTISPSSRDRQLRAENLISETDAVNPLTILGDRQPDAWPICRKSKLGPDTGYTLATAIFSVGPKSAHWKVYTDIAAAPVHQGTVTANLVSV